MLFDIATGIIVGSSFAMADSAEKCTWMLVGAGVLFAVLPDLDFLLSRLLRMPRSDARHRELLHLPLLYLPVGVLVLYPFGRELVGVFLAASVCHFLHDSIGIGWGIRWLYPLTRDSYSFLYHIHDMSAVPRIPAYKFVFVWRESELNETVDKYGDPHWLRNIYLTLHPYSAIEGIALVAVLVYFAVLSTQ